MVTFIYYGNRFRDEEIYMLTKHSNNLLIISSLLAITGLALMFSSINFGISLGDSWLDNQEDGIYDTDQYNMVVETHKNNFIIIGSVLFGTGILTLILTYFTFILGKKDNDKLV